MLCSRGEDVGGMFFLQLTTAVDGRKCRIKKRESQGLINKAGTLEQDGVMHTQGCKRYLRVY